MSPEQVSGAPGSFIHVTVLSPPRCVLPSCPIPSSPSLSSTPHPRGPDTWDPMERTAIPSMSHSEARGFCNPTTENPTGFKSWFAIVWLWRWGKGGGTRASVSSSVRYRYSKQHLSLRAPGRIEYSMTCEAFTVMPGRS